MRCVTLAWWYVSIKPLCYIPETKLLTIVQRALQLKDAGNNSAVIKCLLADSQQWQTLRDRSIDHVVALEGVVDTFRTSPILHAEMMPPPDRVNPNRETVPTAKLARLAELVAVLKDECAQGLLKLDSQTRDMIELVKISGSDLVVVAS